MFKLFLSITAILMQEEAPVTPIPAAPSVAEERIAALIEREEKLRELKALHNELKALEEAGRGVKASQVYRGVKVIAMENAQSLTIIKPKIFVDKEDSSEALQSFFV